MTLATPHSVSDAVKAVANHEELWCLTQDLLITEPDLAAGFQHTKFLVMDEADRLLEASFQPDLRAILTKLPAKRQTLLFSATMTKNLVALQKAVLPDAYHFQVNIYHKNLSLVGEGQGRRGPRGVSSAQHTAWHNVQACTVHMLLCSVITHASAQ